MSDQATIECERLRGKLAKAEARNSVLFDALHEIRSQASMLKGYIPEFAKIERIADAAMNHNPEVK